MRPMRTLLIVSLLILGIAIALYFISAVAVNWFSAETRRLLLWFGITLPAALALLAGLDQAFNLVERFRQRGVAQSEIPTGVQVTLDNRSLTYIAHQYQSGPQPAEYDAPAFDEALKHYLGWMERHYGRLDLRGVEERHTKVHTLTLDDVYVSLRATLDPQEDRRQRGPRQLGRKQHDDWLMQLDDSGDLEKRRGGTEGVDMATLLSHSPYLAITGGPGSGKTTYLKVIASTLARAIRSGEPAELQRVQRELGLTEPLPLPIFIPLSEYNRYRRSHASARDPQAGTLRAFINYHLVQTIGRLPADFFERLLNSQRVCLLLLDGLDEVANEQERLLVRTAVENLADSADVRHIVVTSRSRAYQGEARLSAFRVASVQPMTPEQTAALVTRWCQAVYEADEGQREAKRLQSEIEALETLRTRRGEPRLIDTPLLVTIVAIVHYNQTRLPDLRAELYEKCVEVLLAERTKPALDSTLELRRWGGSLTEKRTTLAWLAYCMVSAGKEAGRLVEEAQVVHWLTPRFIERYGAEAAPPRLQEFLEAMRERGSLLSESDGLYQFTHLTFQEFLAAYHLAEGEHAPERIASILLDQDRVQQAWWRETILLLIGYMGLKNEQRALALIRQLSAGEMTVNALAGAELAATGLLELEAPYQAMQDQLAKRLVDLLSAPELPAPAALRGLAGIALSRLGDPRAGVGWEERNGVKLPVIVWGKMVPAGVYTLGDNEHPDQKIRPVTIAQPYQLARYPVTYAQFQCFIEAADVQEARWWEGMPREAKKWREQAFPWDNHPRERVSWYQAIAFCRWLSDKLGYEVDLPTEAEWEAAARYPDGRAYPWGDTFDPDKANTEKSGIGQTSAVGIFPAGRQPELDLYDMSGNVWEWCRNKYHDPTITRVDDSGDRRVVRGGGWGSSAALARAAYRDFDFYYLWNYGLGFRAVRRPPSHDL